MRNVPSVVRWMENFVLPLACMCICRSYYVLYVHNPGVHGNILRTRLKKENGRLGQAIGVVR